MGEKRKAAGKIILAALLTAAVTALFCILQYAIHYIRHPMVRELGAEDTGVLLWGDEEDAYALIPVETSGYELHYLYQNEWDGVGITLLSANGHHMIDNEAGSGGKYGIEICFPKKDQPGGGLGNGNEGEMWEFLYATQRMQRLICGIGDVSSIMEVPSALQGKKAVLVMPADNREEAEKIIGAALSDGNDMGLKDWLVEAAFEDAAAENK